MIPAAGTNNLQTLNSFSALHGESEGEGHEEKWVGSYYTLLLELIRTQFNDESILYEREEELQNINWHHLAVIAELYEVKPFIYHHLRAKWSALLPHDFRKDIDTYFRIASPHAFFQAQELAKVSDILTDHRISNITFKGPSLAVQAHGDMALRRSVDMDVLIPSDELASAEQILIDHGYQPFYKIQRLGRMGKKSYLWLSQQYPFKKAGGIFNLDLHTSVMPPGYRFSRPFESYQKSARLYKISDFTVSGLSAEDLLIVLCYHGTKNRWSTLKYVLDITALVHSNPDIDWQTVTETINKYGDSRVLYIGLTLAERILNLQLPDVISAQINSDKYTQYVVGRLLMILEKRVMDESMTYLQRVQFHLTVQKSIIAKMSYIVHSTCRHVWSIIYN